METIYFKMVWILLKWLKSRDNQERVSISITREETLYDLNQWLRKQEFGNKKEVFFGM